MPHTPLGGGNMAPPIVASPSLRMSMKAWRSSDSHGAADARVVERRHSRLMIRLVLTPVDASCTAHAARLS
jgi:hypothetical protein